MSRSYLEANVDSVTGQYLWYLETLNANPSEYCTFPLSHRPHHRPELSSLARTTFQPFKDFLLRHRYFRLFLHIGLVRLWVNDLPNMLSESS